MHLWSIRYKITSIDFRTIVHSESSICFLDLYVDDLVEVLFDCLFTFIKRLVFGLVLAWDYVCVLDKGKVTIVLIGQLLKSLTIDWCVCCNVDNLILLVNFLHHFSLKLWYLFILFHKTFLILFDILLYHDCFIFLAVNISTWWAWALTLIVWVVHLSYCNFYNWL